MTCYARFGPYTFYTLFGLALIALDRLSKAYALTHFHSHYPITSWFACHLSLNRGISHGLFYSESPFTGYVIITVALIVTSLVFTSALHRLKKNLPVIGESLVIAGAVSNIYDRFVYGAVIDFIELSYRDYIWPHFNAADIFIVCGVGIIILTRQES